MAFSVLILCLTHVNFNSCTEYFHWPSLVALQRAEWKKNSLNRLGITKEIYHSKYKDPVSDLPKRSQSRVFRSTQRNFSVEELAFFFWSKQITVAACLKNQ